MTGHNNETHTLCLFKYAKPSVFLGSILQTNGSYLDHYKVKWVKFNTLWYTQHQTEWSNDFSPLYNLINYYTLTTNWDILPSGNLTNPVLEKLWITYQNICIMIAIFFWSQDNFIPQFNFFLKTSVFHWK